MSWPLWNSSVVASTSNMLSLSGYTPEQWAAAQQNWQQWAQWQEQYAQWQLQYGDKYAEQMMNYQMGTQPPLPPSTPSESRPPPPPEGPPPQTSKRGDEETASATAAAYVAAATSYADAQAALKKSQSAAADPYSVAVGTYYGRPTVNTLTAAKVQYSTASDVAGSSQSAAKASDPYAIKKDAQKGREGEYAWGEDAAAKAGAVGSTDYSYYKTGYSTAEHGWFTGAYAASYAPQVVAPQSAVSEEERQFDVQFKKWEEEFEAWKRQNVNHPDKAAYEEYEKKFQACRVQLMERKEQMRAKRTAAAAAQKPMQTGDAKSAEAHRAAASYYRGYSQKASSSADVSKRENTNNFLSENSNFLVKPPNLKGIPGLDLVEEHGKRTASEAADAADENQSKRPDLKAISKGINNILGDQKLLDMLSMVAQNKAGQNPYGDVDNQDKEKKSRWGDGAGDADKYSQQVMGEIYKSSYQGYGTNYADVALAAQNYAQYNYNAGQHSGAAAQTSTNSQYYQSQTGNQADADKYSSSQLQESAAYYPNAYSTSQHGYEQDQRDYYDAEQMSQYAVGNSLDRQSEMDIGPAAKPQWMDYPIFEADTIVDYQHKPIRPIVDFLEPVQTFDYGHISSNKLKETTKDNLMWLELDAFQKKSSKPADFLNKGYNDSEASNDSTYGNRNVEYPPPRHDDRYRESVDRSRKTEKNFAKERDLEKREDRSRNRYDDRNRYRDRSRERRERYDRRSSSRERSLKKSPDSKPQSPNEKNDTESADPSASNIPSQETKSVVMIDDILEPPGRSVRPEKIVIILRGLPGSGKSYLAKLIKDREVENGGSAPRILSMDDYFICETEISDDDPDGRNPKKREMKYEYDASMESAYISSLLKAFKRTISDGFFPFIIVDSVNDKCEHFNEMESTGKQFGFKVYVCEMDFDVQTCHKRNIHERNLEDIQKLSEDWETTPAKFTLLDATTLLQTAAIDHVQMEDVSDGDMEAEQQSAEPTQNEEEEVLAPFSSKWDNMDDTDKLARLDGTSKPLRHTASTTMEDFLQLDEWEVSKTAQPGKKTVRWADIEERRQQEKMRAIGFVVGQTNWERMTDPTQGSSALTQTKYIERIPKY